MGGIEPICSFEIGGIDAPGGKYVDNTLGRENVEASLGEYILQTLKYQQEFSIPCLIVLVFQLVCERGVSLFGAQIIIVSSSVVNR